MTNTEPDPPDRDTLIAAKALVPNAMVLLEGRNQRTALECLTVGELSIGNWEWNQTTKGCYWDVHLRICLPPPLYLRVTEDPNVVNNVEEEITSALGEAGDVDTAPDENPIYLQAFLAMQPLPEHAAEALKAEVIERLTNKGITNQGRVRSDNPAQTEFAGLYFRSQAEVNLFRAFQDLNILVAPLPVFVKGTGRGSRFEPDFVVVVPPRIMVVEVDGPLHAESPVDAHERLADLSRAGVHVERVRSDECHPLENAEHTAKRLLEIVKQLP